MVCGRLTAERVAETMRRPDEPRRTGRIAKSLPHFAYQIGQIRFRDEGVWPKPLLEFGFGYDPWADGQQREEQLVRFR